MFSCPEIYFERDAVYEDLMMVSSYEGPYGGVRLRIYTLHSPHPSLSEASFPTRDRHWLMLDDAENHRRRPLEVGVHLEGH